MCEVFLHKPRKKCHGLPNTYLHTHVCVVFLVKGCVCFYPLNRGAPHLTLLSWPKRMAQYLREKKYVSVRNTIEQGTSGLVLVTQSCPTRWDPVDYSLCPRDSPGKNTGVGSHSLLHGIFQTLGSNPGLPHCRQILHCLSPRGKNTEQEGLKSAVQVVARAMVLFALRQRRNWNLLSGQRNTVSGGGCPTETLVVAHSHLTILLSWENHRVWGCADRMCVAPSGVWLPSGPIPTCGPRVTVQWGPTSTVECPSLEDELYNHLRVKGADF